ncbi:hypothetical protein GGS21DRAFT_478126 [Xylaria nigripes]|nr:hypothetical protein GGS21DRAFT_478126 [Xylaria nigripes]
MASPEKWYVKVIQVRYTESNDPPPDSIPEIHMALAEINYGFGGRYVWLVPEMTQDPEDACTWTGMETRKDARPDHPDLAAGAGGLYRYLVFRRDRHIVQKIREVALYRKNSASGAINTPDIALLTARGYNGWSNDLNQGRGKDFLYLIWKTDV